MSVMIPIRCLNCGQAGEMPVEKVSARLRCAACKSHALDLDGISTTAALDDIVGYTYKADEYCPDCTATVIADPGGMHPMMEVSSAAAERVLDEWAAREGINREDEYSFDSDEFPKIIFRDMVTEDDHCGQCGRQLSDLEGGERLGSRKTAAVPNIGDVLPDGSTVIEVHAPHTYVVERDGWTSVRQIQWIDAQGNPTEDAPFDHMTYSSKTPLLLPGWTASEHEGGLFDKVKNPFKGDADPAADAYLQQRTQEQQDYSKQYETDHPRRTLKDVGEDLVSPEKSKRNLMGSIHEAVSYTRQHFEHIADAISSAPVDAATRTKLANHFADRMAGGNANFKRDLFVQRASSDPSKRSSKTADSLSDAMEGVTPWWLENQTPIYDSYPEPSPTKKPTYAEPFINPGGYNEPVPPKPGIPPYLSAKLAEIRDGILATNPGMDEHVARHIAVRTLSEAASS